VYVFANWWVPYEGPHWPRCFIWLVVCCCRVARASTVALAAFLRFLIMSPFLLRVDAVRMCMYHHCVPVSARFAFLQRPFSSVHRGRVCLYAAPPSVISAAPPFFMPVTHPPSKLPPLDVLVRSAHYHTSVALWSPLVSSVPPDCRSCWLLRAGIGRLIRSCPDFEVACR
jgi:hypothetical protein